MPTPNIYWDVDASGDWGTAADWSLNRLPKSTDDVGIDTTDRHTVTHSTGTSTWSRGQRLLQGDGRIADLDHLHRQLRPPADGFGQDADLGRRRDGKCIVQSGGRLEGAGTLTVNGPAAFSNDLLETGSGRTVLEGASSLGGNYFFGLDGGRTLENKGAFTLTGDSVLDLGFNPFGTSLGGGTLVNDAGATINIQGEDEINGFFNGHPVSPTPVRWKRRSTPSKATSLSI